MRAVLAVAGLVAVQAAKPISFMVVGDYGRQGKSGQQQVADAMGVLSETEETDFVVLTGDNIYESGIKSASDPVFARTVTDIYTGLKDIPFYSVLGNHDWGGNITAQFDGDALNDDRWHGAMWARAGNEGVTQHGDGMLDVFYIDTNAWVAHPTAKMKAAGIMPQDAGASWWSEWEDAEVARLEAQIAASDARWKMLVGHHGIYSYALAHWSTPKLARLNTVMRQGGVHAYLNGHDHDLMAIRLPADDEDGPLYITSGAGSSCRNDVADPVGDGSLLFSYGFSGFTNIRLTESEMQIEFYDQDGTVLGNINKAWVAAPTCPDDSDSRCITPPAPPKALSMRNLIAQARSYTADLLEFIGIDTPQGRHEYE